MKPTACIRTSAEDFQVDEIPAYAPCGQGPHLFVRVRKTDLTTFECVRRLGQALRLDTREIGYAGMKDRHAVTTQWLSLPWSDGRAIDEVLALQLPDMQVLQATRHTNKLRTGHLDGNRFRIVLRGLGAHGVAEVSAALAQVAQRGVPNAFGPQRFGRDGNNPERALAWLRGQDRGPREPRQRRMLFSSVQSWLFDEVLRRRVADGTWDKVLAGDLAKKHDTGGLFVSEDEAADGPRAERGEISATGPIFGAKMRWPSGRAAELERAVLSEMLGDEQLLNRNAKLGEGTRRVLRLLPTEVQSSPLEGSSECLVAQFVLPKGAYATTLLGEVCELNDVGRAQGDEPPALDSAQSSAACSDAQPAQLLHDTESDPE